MTQSSTNYLLQILAVTAAPAIPIRRTHYFTLDTSPISTLDLISLSAGHRLTLYPNERPSVDIGDGFIVDIVYT